MDRTPQFRVAALYRFCRLVRFAELREPLAAFCSARGIKGTLLLAREGINGTVAGTEAAIAALVAHLEAMPELAGMEIKYSNSNDMPFHRMKVRLKREIVTMGKPDIDPLRDVGAYVEAGDWNALISDPDTIVIDTRNDYEVSLGTFERAINPQTATFSEFPDWVERQAPDFKGKKVAMFCTGGIRCEKATAYVKSLGIDEVFHLKGGILKYLEEVAPEESRWHGECFVFDERVSVGHGLEVGAAELCRACRHPVLPEERKSLKFQEGISCERCFDSRSEADRQRFAERQKQVELAEIRGRGRHIGS
ncbi:oxygen-dependent tRNA uridine(34) hydroxylase TrhO [Mesorhizobium sp. 10J20-29]